ncbi:hypothetical protein CHS0354_016957 [Potamilus streckersoni]|uniref:MAM domain-containing protein n=1 Tax=Potamilus streckersoni TaxID=2493646 RepID=A0AAE0S7Q2_9BIVA|nr:hypothetical protein CHS0354_016957 [Potamilus streckersoni]
MVPCKDNYKCVAKEKLCDFTWDCMDGSDEGHDYCNVSKQCNFETKAKCGYTNISSGATSWNQTAGSLFQIPQFDNTYGTSQG